MAYHELTDIIWKCSWGQNKEKDDKDIRTFLSEKAKELMRDGCFQDDLKLSFVNKILGLSVEEPKCEPMCYVGCPHKPQPSSSKEWCACMNKYPGLKGVCELPDGTDFKVLFCPICGTPRPKVKTLAEKFKAGCVYTFDDDDPVSHPDWERLAEIAKAHYQDRG